jgi:hypothetical protein
VEMGGFSAAKTDQNMGFQQQKLRFDMFWYVLICFDQETLEILPPTIV